MLGTLLSSNDREAWQVGKAWELVLSKTTDNCIAKLAGLELRGQKIGQVLQEWKAI